MNSNRLLTLLSVWESRLTFGSALTQVRDPETCNETERDAQQRVNCSAVREPCDHGAEPAKAAVLNYV